MRYILIPAVVIVAILGQIKDAKDMAKHDEEVKQYHDRLDMAYHDLDVKRFEDEMELAEYKIDYHKMTGHWLRYGMSDNDKKRVDSWRLGLDKSE
jgi:hypothetical protein